uniref:Ig-like domain-containing protein n=1 Tax=Gasterosteus aculeatus aculeatus TaxID=481459 RepID=A0AAQ4PV47_GASAC
MKRKMRAARSSLCDFSFTVYEVMDDSFFTARLLAWTTFILSTHVEAHQVIGGNVTVVEGGTSILPCKLINDKDSLTQMAWRKEPEEDNLISIKPITGMKFVNGVDKRFEFFGDVSDYNGSLRFSNITLRDEGTYTCIFTLFPIGNVQTKILLNVLVPPLTSLEDNRPILGEGEVPLVTCKAAGSKPAAEVRWLKGTLAEKVTERTHVTRHDDGTTTTVSLLSGAPSREIHGHLVECIVTNAALSKEERLPFNIQIYFPPTEVNISMKSEDAFECETEANPHAQFTWSRSDRSGLQSAVRVEGATLRFLSMTSDLNGLYQCEASNLYGKKHSYIYVHVTSEVCRTSFGILIIIMILIGVAALCYKMWKFRMYRTVVVHILKFNIPAVWSRKIYFVVCTSSFVCLLGTGQERTCVQRRGRSKYYSHW